MLQQKKTALLNLIEQIRLFDWDGKLAIKFPEHIDARSIIVNGMSVDILFQSLGRALNQLEAELNGPNNIFLPDSFCKSVDEETDLESLLGEISSNIEFADIESLAINIETLIQYQIIYGFWDKTATRRSKTVLEYEAKFDSLKIIENKIDSYIEKFKVLENDIENSKVNIEKYLSEKQEEFSILTRNQQNSVTIVGDIQESQTRAKVLETNIENAKALAEKGLIDIEKVLNTVQTKIDDIFEKGNEKFDTLSNLTATESEKIEEIKSLLTEVTSKHAYIEQKKQDVIAMVNFMADASMGHSFDNRQRALRKSSNLWMWVSIGMMVLCLTWLTLPAFVPKLLVVYPDSWLNVLSFAGKSAVIFIILGFVIRQYAKERALQEEYAFKTAIALTISAYLDKISDEADDSRRKMIIDTVEKMYTQPKIHNESSPGLFGLRKKTIDNITNGVVNGIGTVLSKKTE